jgi:hypothetical protein
MRLQRRSEHAASVPAASVQMQKRAHTCAHLHPRVHARTSTRARTHEHARALARARAPAHACTRRQADAGRARARTVHLPQLLRLGECDDQLIRQQRRHRKLPPHVRTQAGARALSPAWAWVAVRACTWVRVPPCGGRACSCVRMLVAGAIASGRATDSTSDALRQKKARRAEPVFLCLVLYGKRTSVRPIGAAVRACGGALAVPRG